MTRPTAAEVKWLNQASCAYDAWIASSKAYLIAQGATFFDYSAWAWGRYMAIAAKRQALDKQRRAAGDREIKDRLDEIMKDGQGIGAEYRLTRARSRAIAAIVDMTSERGRLYCSYEGLARAASISSRSACTIRAELESLGVLKRTRTGGLRGDGAKCSNKYTVKYNRLREVLGIENKWDSKYTSGHSEKNGWVASLHPTVFMDITNAYYSQDGYAHYSRSARQMRRLAQRARECGKLVGMKFQSGGNVLNEQEFCALTALLNQKRSSIINPLRYLTPKNMLPDVKKTNKCTLQSSSSDDQATPDKPRFTTKHLNPILRDHLNLLPASKQHEIVTYIDSHIATFTHKKLAILAGNQLLKVQLQAAKALPNR